MGCEFGTNRLETLDYGNQDSVSYTYDDQGRLILETYEDGETVRYAYDNSGNLATVTDSETGVVTTYYYDLLNRQSGYRETGASLNHSVIYLYDAKNNLSSMTETVGEVTKTYTYTYNEFNRLTSMTVDGVTVEYTYDDFGRLTQQVTKQGETVILTEPVTYSPGSGDNTTSGQVRTYNGLTYTYDGNGNITYFGDGQINSNYYWYDSQNQLIRAESEDQNRIQIWTYDDAGNILSRNEYAFSDYNLQTPLESVTYTYGDTEWGDLLTAYNGNAITYDNIGNPLTDGTWTYTWKHGRQLVSMTKSGTTWNYTYGADGLRTKRTNGTTTYSYVYNGDKLTQMAVDGYTLYFTYDANGTPLTLSMNSTVYYYKTNLQGDVIGILRSNGTQVVTYSYDAWGNMTYSATDQIVEYNPLTYRGYVYDNETGLYYLQSRYYNPEWGRFINADGLISTGQGFTGNNMFAYCGNNPPNMIDHSGNKPGDLFDSPEDAAIDFAICYNSSSISDMQEYGSAIYKVDKVFVTYTIFSKTYHFLWWSWTVQYTVPSLSIESYYSYTEPAIGKNGNSVLPNFATLYPIVSTVHTHANYDPKYDNENFSKGDWSDIGWSNFFGMDSYLVTPGGYLKKYTFATGEVTEIPCDIPWDPNSPDH